MKKITSIMLALLMIVSIIPMSVLADSNYSWTVATSVESTIAKGVTQTANVAYNTEGNRVAFYTVTADITRDDVDIYANYYNNQLVELGMQTVIDQAHAAEKNHADVPNYKVVATTNADFYNMSTGKPIGVLVMEGTAISEMGTTRSFFGIKKDGTPIVGKAGTYASVASELQEAVGGGVVMLYDGKILVNNDRTSTNAMYPRSIAGYTPEGKIVLLVADGSQPPVSYGMSYYDVALQMQAMGCTYAIELDGGGSATMATKAEGEDELSVLNNPCDGAMRTVSSSLMIVSTAVADGTFDHAALTAEETYVTPESTVKVSAVGADAAGSAAEIPEDATWKLKDASMGTVKDGVFTSSGKVGDAVVQMVYNGNVVGETTIKVVIPEEISFAYDNIVVPYDKTLEFTINATVNNGVNEVVLKDGDIEYTLSNAKLGTVNGNKFTACSASAGLTAGSVTAAFKYDKTITDTATLTFGRGSEIAYDFENDDISGFEFKSGYFHKDPKYGRWVFGEVSVEDEETGRVKNGEKSLALVNDYSRTGNMGWKSLALKGLNIDLTDAVRVGFWMYVPKEAIGMCEVDFNNSIVVDDFYSTVLSDGFDGQWFYVSCPASKLGGKLDSLYFYWVDSGLEKYTNYASEFTVFIDDITVDYSDAVSDRKIPTFVSTRMSYDGLSDAVAINGQTVTENELLLIGRVSDDTAIDASSVEMYIDGNKLPDDMVSCSNAGFISTSENITFADGPHDVTYVIRDLEGNEATATRSFTVDTGSNLSTVKFVPQDPNAKEIPIGSVQWFDLVATDIEKVEKITTTIDLDGTSNWELEGMEVAYGFEAEFSVDKFTNDATITLTKTGDVELTGEQVVASIPVRTWVYRNHLDYPDNIYNGTDTGDSIAANTPHAIWKTDAIRRISMIIKVDAGKVEFTDGTTSTFASKEREITTELKYHRDETQLATNKTAIAAKYAFHEHKAVAIADKAATCTEAGYTGRTVCAGCKCNDYVTGQCDAVQGCGSVVDWGTIIPATGHTYEVEDGVLKCKDCDKLFNGELDGKTYVDGIALDGWVGDKYYKDGAMFTGVKAVDGVYYDFGKDGNSKGKFTGDFTGENGKHYYAKLGKLESGWFTINDEWHYFDETTFAGVSGEVISKKFSYITYKFDENGKLTDGVWYHDGTGYRYYYGPDYYRKGFQTIDGKTYAFLDNVRLEGGVYRIKYSQSGAGWQLANFDENGVYLGDVEGEGLVDCVNGLYYYVDGKPRSGLAKVDGNYYYFNNIEFKAVKDCKYKVSNRNGITDLPYGEYEFDSEGKLIHKNGVYVSGSNYYYYENSKKTNAGLVKIGDDYYYSKDNGLIAVNGTYTVTKTSCDLPAGEKYKFGSDGKMLNGLVDEGKYTFYYENGKRVKAGIVEIDGDYYYIDDNCLPKTNGTYTIRKSTVAEIPIGTKCKFDADGKMYNGVYEEGTSGNRYYYEFGKRVEAGIVESNGEYYYARTGGLCARNGTYTVTKTSVAGVEIGDKCRVHDDARVYHGIENVNGNLYYYNLGKRVNAGLVKVDDDYYYSRENGLIAVNGTYTVTYTSCDLSAGEKYKFGVDGKMLQGVVAEGTAGNSYYYINGKRVAAGLVEFNGDIYYAKANGLIAKNGAYTATDSTIEGLETGLVYKFDLEGKAYQGLVDEGKNTYYYENGRRVNAGLVKVGEDYYCVNKSGIVIKGEEATPTITSCDLPAGVGIKYSFGADGKMLQGIVDGYYYNNGQKTYAGLVKIGEDYYYIGKDFKPVCGKSQFAYFTDCDLAGGENYTFGADGKIVK